MLNHLVYELIVICCSSGAIDQSQHQYLNEMIDKKEKQLQDVFLHYETDRDVHHLLSSLKSILNAVESMASVSSDDTVEWTKGAVSQEDLDADEQDDGEDIEGYDDDDDDDQEGNVLDEEDRESIEQKFLAIIQSMHLDRLESSALRLAIARSDDKIKHALERYRTNQNDEELRKSLHEIAKATIAQTQNEVEEILPEDEEEDEEAEEIFDDYDEEDNDEPKQSDNSPRTGVYTLDPELYAGFSKEDQEFLKSRGWTVRSVDSSTDAKETQVSAGILSPVKLSECLNSVVELEFVRIDFVSHNSCAVSTDCREERT